MELLKLSEHNYIPIHSITRIGRDGDHMYVYYQRGSVTDYFAAIIRDGHTMEEEIQSRLINTASTKGFTNAI